MKPRLLDLFCGAGGCAKGYADAGFEVVGVDIVPQKNYPYEFHQDSALRVLDILISGNLWQGYSYMLRDFDVIHASPPCQGYTELNYQGKECHPKLIGTIRERLISANVPYVIENVDGASSAFPHALMLCGSMFGLQVRRHRLFESSILLFAPMQCQHDRNFYSIHGHHVWNRAKRSPARKDGRWRPGYGTFEEGLNAMGIDWMLRQKELANAIPPAYTHWIGEQLMDYIRQEVAS